MKNQILSVLREHPTGLRLREIAMYDDNLITDCKFVGGCAGNTAGIASLVVGMKAEDAIAKLKGIRCGFKPTSCPDQLSVALTEALSN